jgi:alpha-ribazole phosphatase/probable phosphoglycerate mutase
VTAVTTIDLLRHGEPIGGKRYRGQLDDPLSEKGWKEMHHAVSAETPWQTIISSPLRRCHEFASHLSEKLTLPLAIDERLKEVGFGTWEGLTRKELRAKNPDILRDFYQDPVSNRPEGAEPLDDFNTRVTQAYIEAVAKHQGEHLLIVAHAGVIRSILTHAITAPKEIMYRISIESASLSRIRIDGERPPTLVFMGRKRLS